MKEKLWIFMACKVEMRGIVGIQRQSAMCKGGQVGAIMSRILFNVYISFLGFR